MKNPHRYRLVLTLSILIAIFMTGGTFLWVSSELNDTIYRSTEGYVKNIASASAGIFEMKLDDQMAMLRHQASFFSAINMSDTKSVKTVITTAKISKFFTDVIVADKYGSSWDYFGNYVGNVYDNEYFREAMAGNEYLSRKAHKNIWGYDEFIMSVPIMRGENVVGVVMGTFYLDDLSVLLEDVKIEGGASALMSMQGDIFAMSSNVNDEASFKEYFSFGNGIIDGDGNENAAADYQDLSESEKDATVKRFREESGNSIVIITPIGDYPWLLVTAVKESSLTERTEELYRMVLIIEGVNIFAFAIVILSLIGVFLRNISFEKMNDRFMQVNTQSDTIVFEYDYVRNRVEYGGNYKRFFPGGKSYAQDEHMWDLLNLLHPEDVNIREAIFNIPSNTEAEISGEGRFKCADGNYYWYRIHGNIVRGSNNRPVKFIGNIVNAEAQVNEELRLKQAAETDPLTGILNKGAMEEHTDDIINESNGSELYALYIIDLDNFKKVNDTLGHAIGDKVLTDVARKMSVVFSEQDCIGRIGGDEFSVFLKLQGANVKNGKKIIEAKATTLCEQIDEVYSNGKDDVHVSASIGVSLYPDHGSSFGELYRNADAALYSSKNAGKNRFTMYRGQEG